MLAEPTPPVQPDEEPRPTRPDPRPVAALLDDYLEQLEITRAHVEAL